MSPSAVPARALLPYPLIVLVGFLSIALPLPVLSQHVNEGLGFSLLTAGLVIGLQSIGTILTRQWAGRLADRAGSRRAVLLGLPLAGLSGLLSLLSALMPDPVPALAVLVVARLLMGPAESLILVGAMTWGITRLGAARTGLVMTWQGMAIFGALGIGAPIGLWLMGRFGFAGVSAAMIAVALLGLALVLPLSPVAPLARGARTSALGVFGLIWREGTVLFLSAAPQALLSGYVALHFASRGWEGAGLTLTGFGVGVVATRLLFGGMPDRLGGRRVALISLGVEALGQALLWTAPGPVMAVVGATLSGAGMSLIFPAMGVEAVRRVPAASRGLAVGSFSAFFDAAIGLAGPVGGLIALVGGFPAVFLAGGIACLIGIALLLRGGWGHA
ncbi:MFS transporter [Muricoccus aerilatus]|uniref:MFS transporter n=1 Tax=Muricoccus aerilatus TaxID=452982 RepID=UPI0005C14D64|nr:MFS transporter [Roseomonas aerilata]